MPRMKHLRGSWLHRRLGDQLLDTRLWELNRKSLSQGLAIGVFSGMLPIPFQSLPATLLALLFRANLPAALVGCWISNPLTVPLFILLSLQIGTFILGQGSVMHSFGHQPFWNLVRHMPLPILIGSTLLNIAATILAYFAGGWSYDLISHLVKHKANKEPQQKKKGKQNVPNP